MNKAEVNVDLRETQESNFLVIHQSTMIGMLIMLATLGVIGLILYAFKVFWCRGIHEVCRGKRRRTMEENELAERGEMTGNKSSTVTLIK